jgi:DNA modification methylase
MRVNVAEDYGAFLGAKVVPGVRYEGGFAILPSWNAAAKETAEAITALAPHLHEYQRFAATFAVARQRAALFLECGLGKTSVALTWIEHVREGRPAIICAPLAALHEFENERDRFFPGVPLTIVPTADFPAWLAVPRGIALVTHHAFTVDRDLSGVGAFVLDESSILKSGEGAIAQALVRSCRPIQKRLALSATPAPNDPTEYATHATWLGYLRSDAEFRARFFVRDGKDWRIKGHAAEALPRWLARFALWMRDPAAYGMPCAALPAEDFRTQIVSLSASTNGVERDLFGAPANALGMSERARLRGDLYADPARAEAAVRLCAGHRSIVWCIRNEQADSIERALRAAGIRVAQIGGTTRDEDRVAIVTAFREGEVETLVAKPKVIGHGTNLQCADRMIFAGYDESYEAVHQAIRRAHRQGRVGKLSVFYLAAPEEMPILSTLDAKGKQWHTEADRQEREFAVALAGDLDAYHHGRTMSIAAEESERLPTAQGPHFRLLHGDSIALMPAEMEADSVDLSVFSPPFASLFTYSSEAADMGNCSDQDAVEFNLHFGHFSRELLRVMKPGRVVCLHLSQLIAFRARHGRKGMRDFRGDVVRVMEAAGFLYYGEFVVPKNPQATAIRTKTERLQFSQFKRDSLESSPALNDYVLEFRKPGTQAVPVLNDVSNEEWIRWASGVWDDVRETEVLSYHSARAEEDERHIAPLQLTVIERCVRLWSNPGEVVFTPFLGIGSEVYTAIRQRRIGWGIELKPEYFKQAVRNSETAVSLTYDAPTLFDEPAEDRSLVAA